MLTIICGENSVSSFNYYTDLKKEYKTKGYEIINLESNNLEEISSWMRESQSLFSSKKIFFTENINKKLSRKLNLKINKIIENLVKDKKIEVITWEEEISSRFLKFPKEAKIKEFKLSETIFKLQDALFPGNLNNFIMILNQLNQTSDENVIFIMIARHIRNLLLVKMGKINNKLQKWQIYKLKTLASKWETDKLINFYDSFHKIDVWQKTSSNPYSLKKSIDILACYYL